MPLSPEAVAFFFEHAGYSHAPDETPEAGKIRGALSLARAERHATRKGWYVEWSDDWEVGSHVAGAPEAYDVEPDTCEIATLYNRHRHMLGSLGCVDDASDDYRRVVAAELASEAIAERVARKASARTHAACEYVHDGTDTDGTEWHRCTTHDQLAPSDEAPCAGYYPPPYVAPVNA